MQLSKDLMAPVLGSQSNDFEIQRAKKTHAVNIKRLVSKRLQ
jgi:hypothetical protein